MEVATQTDISWLENDVIKLEPVLCDVRETESYEITEASNDTSNDTSSNINDTSSNNNDSDNNNSNSDINDSDNSDTDDKEPVTNLPAVLQYLRESDSLSSNYFSIDNATLGVPNSENQVDRKCCHFCGESLPNFSLLTEQDITFCCDSFKEYCVLVTYYTKRMQEIQMRKKPLKLNLPHHMKDKKTPHEKALEKIRRKQRWEEKQIRELRMLQNSSVMSMSRQTKVIQFSLSSSTNTGWINPSPQIERKSIKKQKKLHQFLPTTNTTIDVLKSLELTYYSSGKTLSLCLPNNESQCYPSGNLAILQMYLYHSIKLYLLYKDEKNGELIGYLDDFGRCWISGGVHSIKFFSSFQKGFLFDVQGRTKYWSWNETSQLLLPLVFKLGQHLTVQYNNQDDVLIMLAAQQKHYKYQVKRVTATETLVSKYVQVYQQDLEKLQHRFNLHLKSLQQETKLYISKQRQCLPSIQDNRKKPNKRTNIVTFQ